MRPFPEFNNKKPSSRPQRGKEQRRTEMELRGFLSLSRDTDNAAEHSGHPCKLFAVRDGSTSGQEIVQHFSPSISNRPKLNAWLDLAVEIRACSYD